MTKTQTDADGRHGLLPLITNLFSRRHPRHHDSFVHFDGIDPHTEQDIGFHADGRLHERDEWRF